MSSFAASAPTAPAIRHHDVTDPADHGPRPSRILVLLEALAYAGASIDPSAALAATRFARIRDQELGHGRR